MLLHFYKMTGAGNDFIMVDNRDLSLTSALDQETIEALCDRRFGIGADGLIAVESPLSQEASCRMRYYNADGGEAEMCGNGARCFAAFASALTDDEADTLCFDTQAGLIRARFEKEGNITISLPTPHSLELDKIGADKVIPAPVHSLNTGVPHAVVFLDDILNIDIASMGPYLRYHEAFAPAGTNVNCVQVLAPDHIAIRTYERGVEDETLACGTGMTASALIHAAKTGAPSPISVDVAGGDTLQVSFQRNGDSFTKVHLTGPADFVFEGDVEI